MEAKLEQSETRLAQLAAACRSALQAAPGTAGREQVRDLLAEALQDEAFVAQQFEGETSERKLLYEDPELGFCILAHSYVDARESAPHDHGPSWAIYGQAAGETAMTEWQLVEPASVEKPGKVRKSTTYTLAPGMAYLYNEGVLHSPRRDGPTRLIRIEGQNMDRVSRLRYEAV
jgi:predicted metal-dependent enzyme (double-stranded beta helix superfamily)